MTWKPFIDAETARRCWDVIGEIERSLLVEGTGEAHSLSGGSAGIGVFFAYLDAARGGSGPAADTALEAIGRSIDALGESVLPPNLYSGFTGIGWAVEHLARRFFGADEDLCSAIDDGLQKLLSIPGQRLNYELIAGLSGYGVYLAERLPNAAAEELLTRIVDLLEETAEVSEEGVTWPTLPEWMPDWQREAMPDGCYNLGVAHGLPGVLGFLAAARRAGFDDPRLPRLAEGLARWLLARKLGREDSVFPAMWAPDRPAEPTRTAWCYGDPGIAAVLLSAARSFGRPDWEEEALALARLCARRSEKAAQTVDAGLCHGTAGLAHLFNRFHQATGDPELGEAALAWTRRTLDIRRPGEGVAGYPSYMPSERDRTGGDWSPQPGLLIGAAGVGLALLGAVSDVEPLWDRILLTAIPPRDLENQP
ncbi:MAG TPA: lanthionine synthetase C family protein [Thermoanaerobaculia bacterium]|nr:lanthionine synthetase C family protein [Thermoanaerobaculia bacterium]